MFLKNLKKICENFFSHCHQCCILNTPTALIGLTVLSALWLARDRSEGRKHAEPRRVVLRKTQVDLGLKICGGNLTGVFVEALEEDSPARGADGLQPGDLILEVLVHHKQPHVTLFDSVLDGVVMSFPVCSVTRWVWRIRPLRRCIWRCWNPWRTSPSESRTDPSTSGGSKTHSEMVFTSGNRLKPVCLSIRNRSRVSTGIPGFLRSLEKYGIWFKYFPGLEKYGKKKAEYGKIVSFFYSRKFRI